MKWNMVEWLLEEEANATTLPPVQIGEYVSEELAELRRIHRAVLQQAILDLRSAHEVALGVRGKFSNFSDVAEIESYFLEDEYFAETGEPAEDLTRAELPLFAKRKPILFSEPPNPTMYLKQESDGPFSFATSCSVFGINLRTAREQVREWISKLKQRAVPMVILPLESKKHWTRAVRRYARLKAEGQMELFGTATI